MMFGIPAALLLGMGAAPYILMQDMERAWLEEWLFAWRFIGWHFSEYVPRKA